ncbi:expressed unknown protein [Seminavis robusta]|uniref:Uncharacterized protein n=1 Tax=Seminavis robusta TaxID=568900 RepID=A0A9N8HHR9_9STRA|nr:expressed unknown protein [Seminavis robusta]|eukprot:Sro461_g147840.1 n/a (444) ;mRNA; f:54002-55333
MSKFLHKFGGMMNSQEVGRSRQTEMHEKKTAMEVEDEEAVPIEAENYSSGVETSEDDEEAYEEEEVCEVDDTLSCTQVNDGFMSNNISASEEEMGMGFAKLGTGYDSTMVVSLTLSSVLILTLLGWNVGFRRKQRRRNRRWKNDSQMILTKVEDVVAQLEDRDEQVDVLKQQIKLQEAAAAKEKEDLQKEFSNVLKTKDEEYQALRTTLEELSNQQKDTDARLERVTAELNRSMEAQQDYECQLLEQKLHASQLNTTLAERDATIEGLQQTSTAQLARIQELHQKIKADAVKAEEIIGDLTSERDERFAILQQENDAIKSTVMGMLKSTQEKYDADKMTLKREMGKRDAKIVSLQEELWKSNALLKRLKTNGSVDQSALSQSMRNLISEIKETKDAAAEATGKGPKERRSSTYDAAEAILEENGECDEFKALETLLSRRRPNK